VANASPDELKNSDVPVTTERNDMMLTIEYRYGPLAPPQTSDHFSFSELGMPDSVRGVRQSFGKVLECSTA
jgi:hypothetical protein